MIHIFTKTNSCSQNCLLKLKQINVLGDFILATRDCNSYKRVKLMSKANVNDERGLIFNMPVWEHTPQGNKFWLDIYRNLI